ncbi:MAG: type II secretion system F family protein [Gemmatimonadota bacterium]
MLLLIAFLVCATVSLLTYAAVSLVSPKPSGLRGRLADIQQLGPFTEGVISVHRRRAQREKLEGLLRTLGERAVRPKTDLGETRRALQMAGFRNEEAPVIYYGLRMFLAAALPAVAILLGIVTNAQVLKTVPLLAITGALGYYVPRFLLKRRIRTRQEAIRLGLADALDLLVICVEAGLGLNQAIVRVAEEMLHACRPISEEFHLVNLEMRAGKSRADALRQLSERTGVEDLQSLVAMLVQTDRFGTSIAQSLRVHSDTLRTKRRQRAEEAAAKTTIKLVFPLVLFIFPAMFVVILGPAMLHIIEQLRGVVK